jgi:hypothetical protein
VFLGGALAWEGGSSMGNSLQYFHAVRVDYNNGVPTVLPINDLEQFWGCP